MIISISIAGKSSDETGSHLVELIKVNLADD